MSGVRDVTVLFYLIDFGGNRPVLYWKVRFTKSGLDKDVETDGGRQILILPDSSCS